MRAKILLLPGNDKGNVLLKMAEEVLTDISVSFSHSFSLMYDKIGTQSDYIYGAPLTEETVDMAKECHAVLLGDTEVEGGDALIEALKIPAKTRAFSLNGGKRFYILTLSALDIDTLTNAFRQAFSLAKSEDMPVHFIAPSSNKRNDMLSAVKAQRGFFSSIDAKEISPQEGVEYLIYNPQEVGVLLLPPYASSMLTHMATLLHGVPMLLFDQAVSQTAFVYAPLLEKDISKDEVNPLGTFYAVAQMLREALHLEKEADCIEAAIQNVLHAGWRTEDMPVTNEALLISKERMKELVTEQIVLAGELLNK